MAPHSGRTRPSTPDSRPPIAARMDLIRLPSKAPAFAYEVSGPRGGQARLYRQRAARGGAFHRSNPTSLSPASRPSVHPAPPATRFPRCAKARPRCASVIPLWVPPPTRNGPTGACMPLAGLVTYSEREWRTPPPSPRRRHGRQRECVLWTRRVQRRGRAGALAPRGPTAWEFPARSLLASITATVMRWNTTRANPQPRWLAPAGGRAKDTTRSVVEPARELRKDLHPSIRAIRGAMTLSPCGPHFSAARPRLSASQRCASCGISRNRTGASASFSDSTRRCSACEFAGEDGSRVDRCRSESQ